MFSNFFQLKKVRKWSLSLRLFPDLGQAVCRRWINTDAEVDSTMTFKTEGYETLDSFVAELQDFVMCVVFFLLLWQLSDYCRITVVLETLSF